ncbi:MAG: hypothetical protein E4G90_02485 [Gemmatimonadales bacterium]|nr:MAG: hypothetical protein E4G90_02485 [Gemmatimonadales bacterium]
MIDIESGTAHFDVGLFAQSLGVPPDMVRERIDGRVMGLLVELLARPILGGEFSSPGSQWDQTDGGGGRWEVRALTERGVDFSPSCTRGAGRKFDADLFQVKLSLLAHGTGGGYLVFDVQLPGPALWQSVPPTSAPIDWWKLPAYGVRGWWTAGLLNSQAGLSRKAFLEMTDPENL